MWLCVKNCCGTHNISLSFSSLQYYFDKKYFVVKPSFFGQVIPLSKSYPFDPILHTFF